MGGAREGRKLGGRKRRRGVALVTPAIARLPLGIRLNIRREVK